MFSEREATTHKIPAKVVPRPEIVGSLHDEQMARALGYPAALVPGIDVYAYLARLTLASCEIALGSSGPITHTAKMTRKPA